LNPNRYAIIYNSRYGNNDIVLNNNTSTAAAVTYPSSPYPKPYQNHYYNEYHEGILEIANSFLKILLNQLVNKTMIAAVKGK
jgi:hypothetical protein